MNMDKILGTCEICKFALIQSDDPNLIWECEMCMNNNVGIEYPDGVEIWG